MAKWDRTIPATGAALVSKVVRDDFKAIDEALLGASAKAQSPANLTVRVESFVYLGSDGVTRKSYAGGNSPTLTAPTTNPRIDLLTIDDAGTLAWVLGTEAASPVAPNYQAGKVTICEVFARVGMTTMSDDDSGSGGYISRQGARAWAWPTDPAFKSLTLALGTITTDKKILDLTATWNNAGVSFTALRINITDPASAAGSLLASLQVGGVPKWTVDKSGAVIQKNGLTIIVPDGVAGVGISQETHGSPAYNVVDALHSRGTKASPTASGPDILGALRWFGYTGSGYAISPYILARATEAFSASQLGSQLELHAIAPGTTTDLTVMTLQNGVQVGAPTGGYKGVGTINVATDLYRNGTAYSNPDYVLERHFRGHVEAFADREGAADYPGLLPLAAVREIMRTAHRLPRMPHGMGLFEGSDRLLEKLEEVFLYLLEHEDRLHVLEGR